MGAKEVLSYLEEKGSPNIKKIFVNHGALEPFWGVRVGDKKPLVKKIKKDYKLAKDLYKTGNSDAMYFGGLIADESQMTIEELRTYAQETSWYMISEFAMPWVNVEMEGTACKVPLVSEYISKIFDAGRFGKKRKVARC